MREFYHLLLPFLLLAIFGSIVLSITNLLVEDRMSDNVRQNNLQILNRVIALNYDNDLYKDTIKIAISNTASSQQHIMAYRARKSLRPLGLVLMPVSAKGYNGPILLAIGIKHDGTLQGIQVLKHEETVGLGGNVDHNKSDWLSMFQGHSLNQLSPEAWTIKSDGGYFDQISGASITSRGVISAVYNSLKLHEQQHSVLYTIQD